MKWLALAAALAACGKSEPAKPAIESVALPAGTGDPVGTAVMFMLWRDGALVEIDPASVFGDRTKPFRGVGAKGVLTGPFAPAKPHDEVPPKAPTAVFAPADAHITDVMTAIGVTMPDRCWGFAVADHGKLELLEPSPCPPPPVGDSPSNAIYLHDGSTRLYEMKALAGLEVQSADALKKVLAEWKAADPRSDLQLAGDDTTPVSAIVDMLALAHANGFATARVVRAVPAKVTR